MTPAQREQNVLLGIGFMMLAATILPVMNGFVQWLNLRYPPEQVVWARITGHLVIMLAIMLPRSGLRVLATNRPALQFGRSLCQLSSTSFYFVGLVTLPLAKAAAVGFLAPFIVTLLAWPMLGERLRAARLAAVVLGFIGVLVVIQPGSDSFQVASLLILGSAVTNALYQVLTRKVAPHDRPETSVLWSALVGGVVLTLAVPWFWTTPATLLDLAAFIAVGAIGAAGHYCVARAFGLGPAAVIAPFHYWQIVSATIMGVLLTGLWPEGATWLGAAIIVGAGVFLAINEGRRR
ncbi:DMT family transporter [Roseomonas sp. AR75]|uniref:DMT family transporter n=1 Tax=Roseomonas sp. AR75 TaxID=2562311 RepID=UPI0010C007BF|nr:DMT family transporter [Roseomonas sp. AR75]